MLEHFKGTDVPTLQKDHDYEESKVGKELCKWLIEHKKAVAVKKAETVDLDADMLGEPTGEVVEDNKDLEKETLIDKVIYKATPKKKSKGKGGKK